MADKAQQYKYKANRCASCGMAVEEMVERFGTFSRMFELHHVDPDKKDPDYNNLIKQNLSSKQVDELDKSILLCRNCHGIVHAQNTKVSAVIKVNDGAREVSQKLTGWLIHDQKEKSFKILCEEKLLLERYREKDGSGNEEIIYGVDLESGERFISNLKGLNEGETYCLWSAETNTLMIRVTKIGENLKVENNVEFRFFSMEAPSLPKEQRFWYRNGVVLYGDGQVQTEGLYTFHLVQSMLSLTRVAT